MAQNEVLATARNNNYKIWPKKTLFQNPEGKAFGHYVCMEFMYQNKVFIQTFLQTLKAEIESNEIYLKIK